MFRLKDHIISLVAVFLALGLGILIGSGMGDDMLVKQQRLLIEQLSKDFRSLREESMTLEAKVQLLSRDLDFWSKYQEALYPGLVTGVLDSKKAAIICHGAPLLEELVAILYDAGAQLTALAQISPQSQWSDHDGLLASALAVFISSGAVGEEGEAVLKSYAENESIHLQSKGRGRPDAVIFLLGDRHNIDRRFVLALAEKLAAEKIRVVAVELSDIADSILEDFMEMGLPTIDNADTVFGRISLLAVLRGATGHFGFKPGAESFIAPF